MIKYIVSIASDWEDNRCYLDSKLADTKEQAHSILKAYKEECLKKCHEQEDDYFTLEEEEGSYYCYVGTEAYPEPSMGWEKCKIIQIEI